VCCGLLFQINTSISQHYNGIQKFHAILNLYSLPGIFAERWEKLGSQASMLTVLFWQSRTPIYYSQLFINVTTSKYLPSHTYQMELSAVGCPAIRLELICISNGHSNKNTSARASGLGAPDKNSLSGREFVRDVIILNGKRENTNPARFPYSLPARVETEGKRVHCATGREFYLAANSERRLSCGVSTKQCTCQKFTQNLMQIFNNREAPLRIYTDARFFTSSSSLGNICRLHANFLISV
jgi:hypothetical protein